jgi:hypothetical protein
MKTNSEFQNDSNLRTTSKLKSTGNQQVNNKIDSQPTGDQQN